LDEYNFQVPGLSQKLEQFKAVVHHGPGFFTLTRMDLAAFDQEEKNVITRAICYHLEDPISGNNKQDATQASIGTAFQSLKLQSTH
jgi:hypothetical protein